MPLTIRTERKSSPNYNEDPRARLIDELQRISRNMRDDELGDDVSEQTRKFYNAEGVIGKVPSFRPNVQVPQLQTIVIQEATELTDINPKVYIFNKKDGSVDEERSTSLQEEWRSLWVNNHILISSIWAQLAGMGYITFCYDPSAEGGFGKICCEHLGIGDLDWDPGAHSRHDATYVIRETRYYPDQVTHYWPETGAGMEAEAINPGLGARQSPASVGTLPPKIRFPEGPMRQFDGPVEGEGVEADGRLRVRFLFIDDRTIEVVREEAGSDAASLVESISKKDKSSSFRKTLRYPNKRVIVCASGRTSRCVADGDNPTPGGVYPYIPIYGFPPLTGFYPPPPARYTRDLQTLSERILTQIFENVVRLNNGVWLIPKGCDIDLQAFGGLPGEVVEYNQQGGKPEAIKPDPINESVLKLVQWLLATQKELQGITPAREGQTSAGNVSAELYEASIFQSKTLQRCRARLLAQSVSEAASLLYDMMCNHYVTQRAYPSDEGGFSIKTWKPIYGMAARDYRVHIDPTSLLPISQAALRQMAPMLKQEQVIDNETLLEALGVPDAKNIAARADREMAMRVLQNAKRR